MLFYAYDENRDTSDLIILNAQEPAKGPVARVTLPQRVPFGFHGNWFPEQA
ncbi:carotenoid oxygenase family protein [Achromobacter marplatensis]|uniref:carotenoid oxygenase family protein n=1 Tax=Achromobacter marplatensis TaxID=470868 RepID=UPI003C73CF81